MTPANLRPTGPSGTRPAVYFWARTIVCPDSLCRAEIPLLSSYWLANSGLGIVWIQPVPTPGFIDLKVRQGSPPRGFDCSVGTVKASSATCPACGTSAGAKDVRGYGKKVGFGRRLYAVLDIAGRDRTYREPTAAEVDGAEHLAASLLEDLPETPDGVSAIPDEHITKSQFRILRGLVYGIDTFRGLFNDRQLYVLATLCQAVRDAHEAMLAEGVDPGRALAVATYLGFLVDKVADYDSSFTSWATSGEFQRSTFARQAIAMVWDYLETDPFNGGDGIYDAHVRWIELAIRHCALTSSSAATVQRGDAQSLSFPDASFDAVIVDPPYYDAIQYGDLSDYFYVRLKRSIGHLHPALFAVPLTPKQQEVIESRADKKSAEYISHDEFERRLGRALAEMARVVKSDGVVAIVFAHTDVAAWEQLLRALRTAGLVVSTSWPMRSEREARSTAHISAVLGSSVVLVCRRRTGHEEGFYDDVVRALEQRIAERLDAFESMGQVGADYFVSAIGPAFEVFARYQRITRLSGEEVDVSDLMVLARQAVAQHAMRRLLGSDSLADLDAESLFYLTWRWEYLTGDVPADEAYKLECAFDVDLGQLARPGGLAVQSGATFSLVGPQERKSIKIGASPSLIDVLQLSCQLWDAGRRRELEELLPDGNRERTMLLGLTGNRDALSEAAARSSATIEALTLFGS